MEKIDARKLSTDVQQQIRYQVIRLRKQGRKHSEISAITGVSRSICSTWWTLYQKGGKNCDLKDGVHSGVPARTKDELKKKAVSHLRKLQKLPGRVMKYFNHPKIAYAAQC